MKLEQMLYNEFDDIDVFKFKSFKILKELVAVERKFIDKLSDELFQDYITITQLRNIYENERFKEFGNFVLKHKKNKNLK